MRSVVFAALAAAFSLGCGSAPALAQPAGLAPGEYGCVGFDGIMAGMGFIVTGPGRYTDLDGGNQGAFVVDGDRIHFQGGHLDGMVARDLDGNGNFNIHSASCSRFR